MEILTPLLAFLLGLTTATTFCAIYILSSVVAFSAGFGKPDKIRPALIALGHFLAIILIGVIALVIGLAIEDYLIYLQIPAALFVLGIGIYLIFAKNKSTCGDACGCKTDSAINKLKTKSLFSSLVFGFSIGLLCVACIFPVFGAILAVTAISGQVAGILLLSYAVGHTLPIILVAYIPYFSEKIAKGKIEKNIENIRKVSGVILVIIGGGLVMQAFACGPDCQKYHHHHNNHYHHKIHEHHHYNHHH